MPPGKSQNTEAFERSSVLLVTYVGCPVDEDYMIKLGNAPHPFQQRDKKKRLGHYLYAVITVAFFNTCIINCCSAAALTSGC
ncbi:hypothetical protein BDB00DRAFT_878508 [Zychaea mexicana]|uniref:uncharacterized protein n=1 Tax=Zychaea mexicana TaxID=64656 RepID=UPI0022FF38AA|nr:uncharacterized protein BDB00DRAFT_878508 [Zychaea mexicana]KAI9484733.1 hypothetical protein BDB00DRAFT_878508 [Zychaea mexicana]